MSIKTTCPECKARFTLGDELEGKKVRCQKCQSVFGPVSRLDEDSGEKITSSARTATRLKKDEDRPARRVKKPVRSGTPVALLASLAVVMVLFIGGVVGGVVWMINKQTEVETPPLPPPAPPTGVASAPSVPNFQGKDGEPHEVLKGPFPPAGFPPAQNAPSEYAQIAVENPVPDVVKNEKDPPVSRDGKLTREATAAVKAGTVYIRVTRNDGGGSGSGFFAAPDAPNLVITNSHVVGMLSPTAPEPTKVEVLVHSGQKNEKTYTGKVLALDRVSDLALIDIGATDGLPKPLPIKTATSIQELDTVVVFGFPFGEQVGKEVTIRPASVSSMRKRNGILERIQTNAGMNPGNSGGPVVDTTGHLVGVSVAGMLKQEIFFAIPAERVYGLLYGRVPNMGIGQPVRKGEKIVAPIRMELIDPRGQIKSVGVEVWTGNAPAGADTSRPAALSQPAAQPGDSPRTRTVHPVVADAAKGPGNAKIQTSKQLRGEVVLPPLPAGKVYWVQPIWIRQNGETVWGSATVYRGGEPLQQNSVDLRTRFVESENRRQVLVSVNNRLLVNENDQEAIASTTTAALSERVMTASPTGATLAVFYQGAASTSKNLPDHHDNEALRPNLPTMKARVQLDASGNVTANQLVGITPSPSSIVMQQFHDSVKSGLDLAYLPLPNRTVKPGESWEVNERTLTMSQAMNSIRMGMMGAPAQLKMTCTYLGTRSTAGRQEAIVGVSGQASEPGASGGRVHGQMAVDVETGTIRSVEMHVSTALPEITTIANGEPQKARLRLAVTVRLQRNL